MDWLGDDCDNSSALAMELPVLRQAFRVGERHRNNGIWFPKRVTKSIIFIAIFMMILVGSCFIPLDFGVYGNRRRQIKLTTI